MASQSENGQLLEHDSGTSNKILQLLAEQVYLLSEVSRIKYFTDRITSF